MQLQNYEIYFIRIEEESFKGQNYNKFFYDFIFAKLTKRYFLYVVKNNAFSSLLQEVELNEKKLF